MAYKYKFFKPSGFEDAVEKLNEIGITLTADDTNGETQHHITFPDGITVDFRCDIGFWVRWIFADANYHTFLMCNGTSTTTAATLDNTSTSSNQFLVCVLDEVGGIYCNGGAYSTTSHYLRDLCNTSSLNASQHNDPSMTQLTLVPLVGNFYSETVSGDATTRHFFSHAFINYQRWFVFGDIISTSDGKRYLGCGWFLFEIGE